MIRLAGVAGRALLGAGALVLLFAAYQLWGTGISEARSQARLRAELEHELPRAAGGATKNALAAGVRAPGRARGRSGPAAPEVAPPSPAPGPGAPIGTIDIPSIGLDQAIVQGVTEGELAQGPGHYPGTPLPGQAGNVAIAGHRTTYRHPFYDLTAVAPGAPVVITTTQGVFTYAATDEFVVTPSDVGVLAPSATPVLTLTTCNPRYSAATRLVLRATLARSQLFEASPGTAAPSGTGGRPDTAAPGHGPAIAARGLAGTPGSPSLPGAVVRGAVAAALVAATFALARQLRRHPVWRGVALVAGAFASMAALFVFFGALAPLVPASF